tara:strand:- start:2638 stop:2856 length:219 start_codon:yes stop_codon:yes gene_type:complete
MIIIIFIVLLVLSLKKKMIKRDTFTYSPAPVDYEPTINPDLFIQKSRISNNEVVICKTINGQYKCKIKKDPC